MPPQPLRPTEQKPETVRIPRFLLALGLLFLAGLIIFVVINFNQAEQFAVLLSKAEPEWLIVAVVLQIGTYICAGSIWNKVVRLANYRVPLKDLAALSVERLSIDQFIPTGGMSGNLVVMQTMKRLGLPHWLAVEALLVDAFSRYISYVALMLITLAVLWINHYITNSTRYIFVTFAVILIVVPIVFLWILDHKNRELPRWMRRIKTIRQLSEAIQAVQTRRIFLPKLLVHASALSTTIFLLDAGTLWATMQAGGHPISFTACLAALVIATTAGLASFLPGGIGGFEAASVATLSLFGVPLEAALAGTLLLRGFTLWIPLIPGLYLARREVNIRL